MSPLVFSLAIVCCVITFGQAAPRLGAKGTDCSDLIVQPIEQLPADYLKGLNTTYYRKFVSANGLPIMGDDNVADYTLKEMARIIRGETNDFISDHLQRLLKKTERIAIWASNENACYLPETIALGDPCTLQDFSGGITFDNIMIFGETSFDCDDAGNAWIGRVLSHEFSHGVNGVFNKDEQKQLDDSYKNAKDNKLWDNPYAMQNSAEYFALGPTSWFQANEVGTCGDYRCNYTLLGQIDKPLYDLVATIYKTPPDWSYQCDEFCIPE